MAEAEPNLLSLINDGDIRVSSVRNKNSKECGKQFLTDSSLETCWCSDIGSPQWVAVKWATPVTVHQIKVKFQGGFCGNRRTLCEAWTEENPNWTVIAKWPLEDAGVVQAIVFKEPKTLTTLRLIFPESTDFYGRIVMYYLDVLGQKN